MQIICCACQRCKKDGAWVGSCGSAGEQRVSHGYCPSCYKKMMKQYGLHARLPAVLQEDGLRPGGSER